MKKIFSTIMMLAMIIAALSLTACSSSDDDEEGGGVNTSFLVGTWKVLDEEKYIQFKNNGTFIDANDTDVHHGTWTLTDKTLLLKYNEEKLVMTISIISISNTNLTMKSLSYYFLSNPSDVYEGDGNTLKLEKVADSAIEKYLK